jgi:hypothetical protein
MPRTSNRAWSGGPQPDPGGHEVRPAQADPGQPPVGLRSADAFPIVRTVSTRNESKRKLVVESAAFGLGYTAVLIWSGSALVASFSDGESNPYWPNIPHLRTDTTGVIAFAVAIVSLVVSRYLQLGRRRGAPPPEEAARPNGVLALQAIAETAAVLGTALVIYLSFNAVTHPITLTLQLTHLWPWPSEGTVRVIGLGCCLFGVGISRYLRASASRPSRAGATSGNADARVDVPA